MKRQPGWMAALAAVFLCLCGMMHIARAQTTEPGTYRGTYYQTRGANTLVLRLIEYPNEFNPRGYVVLAYGTMTTLFGRTAPYGPLWGFSGPYNPDTREIELLVAPMQIVAEGRGTLNPATNSFSIEFTDATSEEGVTEIFDNVALAVGDTAYMVGRWKWLAAAANSGVLLTNPPYGGDFYITSQDPNGRIHGEFRKANPTDVDTIEGIVTGNRINFTRSGSVNGVVFSQVWDGTLGENKIEILGAIEQSSPRWSGDFVAYWPPFFRQVR
jgi:hypothetical protein